VFNIDPIVIKNKNTKVATIVKPVDKYNENNIAKLIVNISTKYNVSVGTNVVAKYLDMGRNCPDEKSNPFK